MAICFIGNGSFLVVHLLVHPALKLRQLGTYSMYVVTGRLCACQQRSNLLPCLTSAGNEAQGPCVNRSLESTGVVARLLTQGAHSAPPLSSASAGPVRCPSSTESMSVS